MLNLESKMQERQYFERIVYNFPVDEKLYGKPSKSDKQKMKRGEVPWRNFLNFKLHLFARK